MMPSWSWVVKKLIIFDVIWGGRSKKLAGINDSASLLTDNILCVSAGQTVDFSPLNTPNWLTVGSYFKFTTGGGSNFGNTYQVVSKSASSVTVTPYLSPALSDFSGQATLDGRIFTIVNDPNIARQSSTGGTMFNSNATSYSGPAVGNVIFNRTDHFHAEMPGPFDANQIITHEYTPAGGLRVQYDTFSGTFIVESPAVVIDNNGNVIVT